MHEYTLYSQLPSARQTQVLQILAGITASQPTEIREQVLIYQRLQQNTTSAKKVNGVKGAGAGAQAGRLSYVKLVRDLREEGGKWRYRQEDVPQPGVTGVISREVQERPLTKLEEDETFLQGKGNYKYISQFILPGHRFTHSNLLLKITRPLSVPEGTGILEPLDAPIPTPGDCKPVDSSGCWLFEVIVRVEEGANSKLLEAAMSEVMAFKKQMEGVIDLRVPERLSLDTRVKG